MIFIVITLSYFFVVQSTDNSVPTIKYDMESSITSRTIKFHNSTLFISITSGPRHSHLRNAARASWLLPCMSSGYCDYRFFVDAPFMTPILQEESDIHYDMVFRNSCSLMSRHPSHINYGNSFLSGKNEHGMKLPNYPVRLLYKVDWKVCFLKWALQNNRMAAFHVFVEDDSFVCTENVLHQCNLLLIKEQSRSSEEEEIIIRAGTIMFDGFDDSSTFMSRRIALAFAEHYPEPGFDCPQISNGTDAYKESIAWTSWGNSWMSRACGWRGALWTHLNISIVVPNTNCMIMFGHSNTTRHATLRVHPKDYIIPDDFPCFDNPMILHHGGAIKIIVRDQRVNHVCEYFLLIDKIKEPSEILLVWNLSRGAWSDHHYLDFTPVLRAEGMDGWTKILHDYGELDKHRFCNNSTTTTTTSGSDTSLFFNCTRRRGEETTEEGTKSSIRSISLLRRNRILLGNHTSTTSNTTNSHIHSHIHSPSNDDVSNLLWFYHGRLLQHVLNQSYQTGSYHGKYN